MTTSSVSTMAAVAVVGTGYWGAKLVRHFHQLGSLGLICDKNETSLSILKEQYDGVDTCTLLSDVLARDDIDGVAISTPSETHFELARESLLAGKHVFVEVPFVLNETEGRKLIEIAEDKNRVLMVGHLMRYHPALIKLKDMTTSGELGRVNYIYSNHMDFGKIGQEENILWSFAPQDISMILSLSGEDPESILTTGGYCLNRRIADVTTAHFEFASGLHAHIFVSWLHPFKEQKLVVVGDQKIAVFDDAHPWPDKLLLYPHPVQWINGLTVPEKAEPERLDILPEDPLRHECRHFIECMSNGHRPTTDGHEDLRVLRILNASQRSLDGHARKVNLDGQPILKDYKPQTRPAESSCRQTVRGDCYIHETAIIDTDVSIGNGTKIWHFSHVLSGSTLGERCNIGQNVVIGPDVEIGSQCKIQNNVSVYKGVTLEDGVFCGPSMVFTNIINPRAEIHKMDQIRPTLVKQGATIGANATIVCGVTLGRYCLVGAGAVVTHDIPDHALVIGNPDRTIGWVCICGERLNDDLDCVACGKQFAKERGGLVEKGSNN
jgi:UDP-2-acetamido-3-amino-2,3-dideoxy-glucuronate N-acetyltransferase